LLVSNQEFLVYHSEKYKKTLIVFKSDKDDAQAELFLPSQKTATLLAKDKKDGAGKWTDATYTLTQWKGVYTLENKKKKVLYQGNTGK
jgi:hypothetical protein